jgi:hypothetical protein
MEEANWALQRCRIGLHHIELKPKTANNNNTNNSNANGSNSSNDHNASSSLSSPHVNGAADDTKRSTSFIAAAAVDAITSIYMT